MFQITKEDHKKEINQAQEEISVLKMQLAQIANEDSSFDSTDKILKNVAVNLINIIQPSEVQIVTWIQFLDSNYT